MLTKTAADNLAAFARGLRAGGKTADPRGIADSLDAFIAEHTPKRDAEAEARRAEVWLRLVESADVEAALNTKTDGEIADLLIEHVWGEDDVLDAKSALVQSAVDRLRRANGGAIEESK